MLRRVAVLGTDISEEISSSFIRVTKIGELGSTLAVTSCLENVSSLTFHNPIGLHDVLRDNFPCLCVADVGSSQETHPWASTAYYGDSFTSHVFTLHFNMRQETKNYLILMVTNTP
jgi:hypothetical protein